MAWHARVKTSRKNHVMLLSVRSIVSGMNGHRGARAVLAATVASEREPEVRKCPANMAELNAKAIPVRSFLAIFPHARLTARSRPGVAGAIARHSVELAGDSRPGVDSKVVMVVWTALVG